jgi:pre-mRNA-splicing factor CDC5/CEF1
MRIMIKGGVWKNTEDEILKAAVMKYGKNQWARISSLLVRKSAKQCKARWYEWLDPSIKKTEWTREEDEKLLHLAKLMPTQWRTIAPIVGRTPAQCLERYEKLLDAAAQRDEDYDPADDPRRLRPGEIDPNPESKPARPDAVDMDEDEKEMLSEARARLANTKGKKAKRKAREKQLEEARRLATLQKKRELKAAGIETVKRAKRTKGLDYNAEIAFERKPAPGFYDVSEERAAQPAAFDESTFKPTTMEEMEGPRKKDLEEQLRKQDIKRAQIAERHDALGAVRVAANLNDPGAPRRRNALVLPAPRVSERELEEIAKLGKSGAAGADFEPGVEDTPGGTLLGEYARAPAGAGPAATPARTPSAGGHDAILREAAHLSVLSRGQTPLLGGENVSLAGSDFSGITPARRDAPTPNPMAAGVTPARSGAASVSATPLRDALRINDAKFSDAPLDARDAKRRAAATRDELRDGLASLPAPANEYRIEVPDAPAEEEEDEEGDGADAMEEDLADIRAREAERRREEEAAALRRRSAAIRRDLPRPPPGSRGPTTEAAPSVVAGGSLHESALAAASTLIAAELASLLAHDAARYPPRGEKARVAEAAPDLPRVEENEMADAAALVAAEVPAVRAEMGHADVSSEALAEALASVRAETVVGVDGQLVARTSLSKAQRIAILERELASVAAAAAADAKRVAKLEHKAGLLTAGLQKRAEALISKLGETGDALAAAREEKASYARLHEREQRAAPRRIETLMELASKARTREAGLQDAYARLKG